jgi:predicted amidohydrolase
MYKECKIEILKELRIAGAQMPVIGDTHCNKDMLFEAIDYAIGQHADILLTPEGSLSGYHNQFDPNHVEQNLRKIVQRAKAGHLGLALGTIFRENDSKFYNELRFYDTTGKFLGYHSKILRTTGEAPLYATIPLRTFKFQGITIGGLICNDVWANPECTEEPDPHLTQQLAKMGAKIIFHAVNGSRSTDPWMDMVHHYHETNLRMRARAGKVWIVTCDNSFPENVPCAAPSGVIQPDGMWKYQAPWQDDHFFTVTISLD